jgi:hypothetical protein
MVGAEPAGQGRPQRWQLAPKPALGQCGQDLRVVGAGHQGFQHRPAGDPDDVGGHAGELGSRRPARPCPAAGPPGCVLGSGSCGSGSAPAAPGSGGAARSWADQAVFDQLGDPGRVGHIGLAAGHVTQVGRVQQPALDLVLQQLPDRLPGAPGRLHPDPGSPRSWSATRPTAATRRSSPRTCASRSDVHHPHQAPRHRWSPSPCARPSQRSARPASPPARSSISATGGRHPEEPLPGESESRARGNSAGYPRLPRQTYQRARGTKKHRRRPDDQHIFIHRGCPATAMGGLSAIEG